MSRDEAIAALEAALDYRFRDRVLLDEALTHRSYAAEHEGQSHYERLEFLGDAVLELATTRYLFANYPLATEGEMAKVRASVVSEPALAALARATGMPVLLRLGRGEEQTGGRDKDSILSDVVEAVLAVVYLEAGFDTAEALIRRHFGPLIDDRAAAPGRRDYKTRLQELLARSGAQPEYRISEDGPEHAKSFAATVLVEGEILGTGAGTSKKRAEQDAARTALDRLADDA